MEVIGKIAVQRNKKERAKKTWLTIGLIAFVITMICEILLGNYAFLALIAPFLYLLNLRNKMGKKVLYKAVAIQVDKNETGNKIEISNCEYRDKVLYSVRFTFNNEEPVLTYVEQKERISIKCIAKKVLYLGDIIIPIFENKRYDIQFFVALEDAKAIAKEFNCPLNIVR